MSSRILLHVLLKKKDLNVSSSSIPMQVLPSSLLVLPSLESAWSLPGHEDIPSATSSDVLQNFEI
jgi:hypothetical protein